MLGPDAKPEIVHPFVGDEFLRFQGRISSKSHHPLKVLGFWQEIPQENTRVGYGAFFKRFPEVSAGCWFQIFFMFTPFFYIGEMIQFD